MAQSCSVQCKRVVASMQGGRRTGRTSVTFCAYLADFNIELQSWASLPPAGASLVHRHREFSCESTRRHLFQLENAVI